MTATKKPLQSTNKQRAIGESSLGEKLAHHVITSQSTDHHKDAKNLF